MQEETIRQSVAMQETFFDKEEEKLEYEDIDMIMGSNKLYQAQSISELGRNPTFGNLAKIRILACDDEPFNLSSMKIIFKSAMR
jgi:hypothetical protein